MADNGGYLQSITRSGEGLFVSVRGAILSMLGLHQKFKRDTNRTSTRPWIDRMRREDNMQAISATPHYIHFLFPAMCRPPESHAVLRRHRFLLANTCSRRSMSVYNMSSTLPARPWHRERRDKQNRSSLASSQLTSIPHLCSNSASSSAVHSWPSSCACPPHAAASEASAARTAVRTALRGLMVYEMRLWGRKVRGGAGRRKK